MCCRTARACPAAAALGTVHCLRSETQTTIGGCARPSPRAAMDVMSSSHATIAPPSPAATVVVGTGPVSFADVVAVARHGATVELSADALAEVRRTRAVIEGLADDAEPHYGVSTGFGALATRHIPPELRAQLQRSLVRSHAAGSGPEVEREVVRALMLLRLSTLATGRTGVRAQVATDLRGAAQRGPHPGRPRVRLPRLLGRPRAAGALRAGADGRGHGARRRRHAARRGATRSPRRHHAGRPAREGGPRADQRHRRHARHAGARDRRPAAAAHHGRHRRRDERRGAARHRRACSPPTCRRCARTRARPRPRRTCAPAGRQPDHGQPPRPGVHPRPGRLLAALRPAGRRRRPRHRRARGDGRRARAGRRHRQPGRARPTAGSSPTATSTAPRSPTCWTSSRSSPPTWPACPSAAPTGSWTSRATTACTRSSPTTRASTPAT